MRRPQAIAKPVTAADHVVATLRSIRDTLGSDKFYALCILLAVSIFGGLNWVTSDDSRMEIVSSIPDGISAECHAKLVRAHFSTSSVEKYEASVASSAATSSDTSCASIGSAE